LRYGHDARVSGLAYRSWSLWHLGFADQAIESLDMATALARERDHGNTTGFALVWGVMIANALMRRAPEIVTAARVALPICAKLAQPMWYSFARVFHGWGSAHQGNLEDALSEIDAGIAGLKAIGTRRWLSLLYDLKAEAHALADQRDEADAAIADACKHLDETGDLACAADLHCVMGHLRSEVDPDAARASYECALEIARAQGSQAMELRAATGLAQLWRGQGKAKDASKLLAPVYGRFTEGFGTPDLIAAKALLDEIGQRG
jgi:predicted ATPase